jgi:hypothetical protein
MRNERSAVAVAVAVAAPRLEADPLLAATLEASQAAGPSAIYLGFGIATRTALSAGTLPFDALAMIMLAEHERRARGAARVVHLIADEHALVNDFAEPAAVARVGQEIEAVVRHVVDAFGFDDYEIVCASAIADPLHHDLQRQARVRCDDPYAARQAADVEWARLRHGATVKVGWTMQPDLDKPSRGHDERYFDAIHAAVFGPNVTYVYGRAGQTLDAARPRTTPYTLTAGERRLALTTSAARIPELCEGARLRRHLTTICAEAERELGVPARGELPDRLTTVLQRIGLAA